MIPRVARAGRSFKGAALYYLHDKGALTSDRVAFTATANLPTERTDIGIAHMIDTATHAAALKKAAGIKGGRPLQKPVYCYSLAWHPTENPSQQEQIEAARATLKKLGVDDRQAIIIGHKDTDHAHVHVMVNRVCPATGKAATMGNDRLILSDWALVYRRERGQEHFCPKRAENQKRRKGEFVKDDSMTRAQWTAWKKAQTREIWDAYRTDREAASASRQAQHDALYRQKEERFALRRDEIKQLYKPIWRDVFRRQEAALKDFDAGITRRLSFALSASSGKGVRLLQAILAKGDLRRDLMRAQETERAAVAEGQKSRIADASREITKAWKYDRDQLRDMHRQEDARAHRDTQHRVDDLWKVDPPSQTGQDFEQAKDRRQLENKTRRNSLDAFFGGDKKAIEDACTQQEHRRQRNRTRKRKRGRDRDDGGRDFTPD